ncbi:MAG: GlmU family protein [Flavobacteriales bacterium]|nr:GlmU family protein [Flavobacteriales bacterium]
MSTVLFDGLGHTSLQPLTLTRPVSYLRVGILTIREKWEKYLGEEIGVRTKDYLSIKFNGIDEACELGIVAGLLPTEDLVETIKELKDGQILMKNGEVLALKPFPASTANFEKILKGSTRLEYDMDVSMVKRPWDIFRLNGQELESDFALLTAGRESEPLHESNTLIGDEENLFIEEGAEVLASVLNVSEGPIYIGKDAEIMEGCLIRGGLALCEHAVLKMGAKIYGPTSIGPFSKVGGEVGNSVILGYTNKGHDGYLGNSVLGEWCNLGADTNTSNLKNNYSNVRAYSYLENDYIETGLQFCGLIMGDHSKSSINTMFNTGTVVGVCANVFDGGFPAKHVPSFSWGGKEGFEKFKLEKAYEVAEKVMERRKIELTEEDKKILEKLSK